MQSGQNKPKQQIITQILPTPVKASRLAFYLKDYPKELKEPLIHGFTTGFDIHSFSQFFLGFKLDR